MTNDRDPSLWELLGLDPQTTVPPLSDDAWSRAVQIAVDPDTPPVGADLIPADDADDLDVDPVAADVDLDDDHDVPNHPGYDEPDLDDGSFADPGHGDGDDLSPDPYGHHDPGLTDPGLTDDPDLG